MIAGSMLASHRLTYRIITQAQAWHHSHRPATSPPFCSQTAEKANADRNNPKERERQIKKKKAKKKSTKLLHTGGKLGGGPQTMRGRQEETEGRARRVEACRPQWLCSSEHTCSASWQSDSVRWLQRLKCFPFPFSLMSLFCLQP